ncbi:recombinase family protein [Spirosoma utsteinense]|uniref:recombinase family protein n=1 Tax=Spirosoma utsteinense TaxID=2585773 RepID=UPI0021D0B4A1|nr:recombinase family protein [Spirosoma utsteinense]
MLISRAITLLTSSTKRGCATRRSNVDRPELDKLLKLCKLKAIKKVLVTELLRLGRCRSETPAPMEAITEVGVSIYAQFIK